MDIKVNNPFYEQKAFVLNTANIEESQKILEQFRLKQFKVLITHHIQRGIDLTVQMVVNYSLPDKFEDFVHRIGRTGRMEDQGYVVNFLDKNDTLY